MQEKNPKLAENIKEGADKVKEGFEKVKDKVQDVYADVSGEAPAEEAKVVDAAEDVVDAQTQEAKE